MRINYGDCDVNLQEWRYSVKSTHTILKELNFSDLNFLMYICKCNTVRQYSFSVVSFFNNFHTGESHHVSKEDAELTASLHIQTVNKILSVPFFELPLYVNSRIMLEQLISKKRLENG